MSKALVEIYKAPLSDIIQRIVDEKQSMLVRPCDVESLAPPLFKESGGEYKQIIYEYKYYGGNKTNRWQLFDLFTASALLAVYKNINTDNQRKFNCLPLKVVACKLWWSALHGNR